MHEKVPVNESIVEEDIGGASKKTSIFVIKAPSLLYMRGSGCVTSSGLHRKYTAQL